MKDYDQLISLVRQLTELRSLALNGDTETMYRIMDQTDDLYRRLALWLREHDAREEVRGVLDAEIQFFEENEQRWIDETGWQFRWALVKGAVYSVFDTYEDALREGYETFGPNSPFLVRQIGGNNTYYIATPFIAGPQRGPKSVRAGIAQAAAGEFAAAPPNVDADLESVRAAREEVRALRESIDQSESTVPYEEFRRTLGDKLVSGLQEFAECDHDWRQQSYKKCKNCGAVKDRVFDPKSVRAVEAESRSAPEQREAGEP